MNASKKYQKIFYIAVIIMAIIAIIILCIGYSKESENDVSNSASSAITLKQSDGKVLVSVSTETIQDGLANMGILITQEYYFTQLEKYTKEKTILQFITSSSDFTYSYDGAVMAGVDFEQIEITKDDDEKKLIVKIPASEIQTVNIDKNTFKIYSENESIWNPLKLEDYNISLAEFENAAKEKAIKNGILERSDEQARNLITNFIKNFPNTSGYEIVFE
ncbi:MAG: DUF4230 domain-containing protein [Butyrivibrio sp.]|nr:DUF4230 domain-containing protein [Butyrivibrio sp.]